MISVFEGIEVKPFLASRSLKGSLALANLRCKVKGKLISRRAKFKRLFVGIEISNRILYDVRMCFWSRQSDIFGTVIMSHLYW